jgi:hypothetical protein
LVPGTHGSLSVLMCWSTVVYGHYASRGFRWIISFSSSFLAFWSRRLILEQKSLFGSCLSTLTNGFLRTGG